jgi:riboflavin kinase/FMN adenylyltransferase
MKIFRGIEEIPAGFGPVVATIGNFDGVHCGHRWVIAEVERRARELGLKAVALTFDPHPVRVLRPDAPHALITPLALKLELLAATGLDAALVLPFTDELSRWSAEDFARRVLVEGLRAQEIHEGENFRFGYQATADVQGLEALGRAMGFGVRAYAPRTLRGGPISSSRIRTLIGAGRLAEARALLGRPFALRSTPASGRGFGTRYTVPTINLASYPELLPANGVYVTALRIGAGTAAETFEAVTNVGNRPTFGEDSFTVESHLLNFHEIALHPETPLELTFLLRLRDEIRWPNPEALKEQIGKDVRRAKRFFALQAVMRDRA